MFEALGAATRRLWTNTTEAQALLEAEAFVVWQNERAGNPVTIDVNGRALDGERRARYPDVDAREHDNRIVAYHQAVSLLSPPVRKSFDEWMLRAAMPLYEREIAAAAAKRGDLTVAPQQGRPATAGNRDLGIG